MSHAEQEILTLPEHLISPLVFIEDHVVLSFMPPYFMGFVLDFVLIVPFV